MSGLRRALVALAVAGFALGLAALALVTTSDRPRDSTPWIVLALTLGWGFIGAGLYAWWRRPENRIGPLMTLVGFLWFLGALQSADAAWAFTLGLALGRCGSARWCTCWSRSRPGACSPGSSGSRW